MAWELYLLISDARMENLTRLFGDETLVSPDKYGRGIEEPLRNALLPYAPLDMMPHWTPLKKTPSSGGGGSKPQSGGSNLPAYIPPEHTGKSRQQKGRGGIRHRGTSGGGKWGIQLNNDDGADHEIELGIDDPDWI